MPAYKDQHWLPSAYLKYFSVDQQNCSSKTSKVWRFDGQTMRCVPVSSQCSADYHYSKEQAAETEQMFQKRENIYCRILDQVRVGQEVSERSMGDLFLCMFDLYLRNDVHKNRTGKEGVEAYNHRIETFLSKILLGRDDGALQKADIIEHIKHCWRLEIITVASDQQFVTSDNPSIWTAVRKPSNNLKPELHLITLPLTPRHIAVAFDRRTLEIVNKPATVGDTHTFNIGQIECAQRCVYMSRCLTEQDIVTAQNHFGRKSPTLCEVNETGWRLMLQYLPPEHHFSFMRSRPPLM